MSDSLHVFDRVRQVVSDSGGHRAKSLGTVVQIDRHSVLVMFDKREWNMHSWGSRCWNVGPDEIVRVGCIYPGCYVLCVPASGDSFSGVVEKIYPDRLVVILKGGFLGYHISSIFPIGLGSVGIDGLKDQDRISVPPVSVYLKELGF